MHILSGYTEVNRQLSEYFSMADFCEGIWLWNERKADISVESEKEWEGMINYTC